MTLAMTSFDHTEHESFEAGEIATSLFRRWRFVAIIAAIGCMLALYMVMTSTPKFALDGAVYLGSPDTDGQDANGNFLTAYENSSDVNTLVSLLQSRALVEKAILETGLNASVTPINAPPLSFWRWKYQYARAIEAFAPKSGGLVAQDAVIADPGSAGYQAVVTFGTGGQFIVTTGSTAKNSKASFSGVLGQPISEDGIRFVLQPATNSGLPAPGSQYRLAITPAKAVADQLLGGALTATAGDSTTGPNQVANLHLLWQNPYQGAAFLNQLMQDFIALQLSWNTESASNTETFVTDELAKVRTQMQQADRALSDYQAKTGILDVSDTAQAMINQLSQYEMQRTSLLLKQEALAQLLSSLRNGHSSNPYLISEIDDPVLTSLSNSLASAEEQLDSQSVNYTAQAPEMQVQQANVNSLIHSMRALLLNNQDIAANNLKNIDTVISQLQTKLQAMPAESLQVDALERASDVSGRLYVLLMQKEEEAEVSKAATTVGSRIISPAEVPLGATTPRATITILGGLLAGLMLGIAAVLARRAFSGRFQSYEEVRRFVPSEILGIIPLTPAFEHETPRLTQDRQSPFCESVRMLRSNLYQNFGQPGAKVIQLTSATIGDGKSTIAVNLARMLADDGKRTVLVDADLHQGKLHQYFRLPRAPGVSDFINRTPTVRPVPVPGQSFHLLPSGNLAVNASELVNMERLGELFTQLRATYDYIVVDCPPLPVVADTLSLARFADLVLSVVYVERTSRRNFSLHLAALRARHLSHGVVVNGVANGDTIYGYGTARNQTLLSRAKRAIS